MLVAPLIVATVPVAADYEDDSEPVGWWTETTVDRNQNKIGDMVEIGSACTIDRGTFDDTIIESGAKLDNSVHIAHNCHLKSGVVVCAQSGLAGSVTVGSNTAMSGHVAIAPGVKIGDQCEIVGHSAVFENFEDKSRIAGYPAKPMKQWLRQVSAIRRLIKK